MRARASLPIMEQLKKQQHQKVKKIVEKYNLPTEVSTLLYSETNNFIRINELQTRTAQLEANWAWTLANINDFLAMTTLGGDQMGPLENERVLKPERIDVNAFTTNDVLTIANVASSHKVSEWR